MAKSSLRRAQRDADAHPGRAEPTAAELGRLVGRVERAAEDIDIRAIVLLVEVTGNQPGLSALRQRITSVLQLAAEAHDDRVAQAPHPDEIAQRNRQAPDLAGIADGSRIAAAQIDRGDKAPWN